MCVRNLGWEEIGGRNAAREETLVQRGLLCFMTLLMPMIAMPIGTGFKAALPQGQAK